MVNRYILHVLPAVELANTTDLGVDDRFSGVASAYHIIFSNILLLFVTGYHIPSPKTSLSTCVARIVRRWFRISPVGEIKT